MLLIKHALDMRMLDRDLRALRDTLLYGHTVTGSRLPRLNVDIICRSLLPFFALPEQNGQKIAAGSQHTCAIQCDGRLVCFGNNCAGQCDVPADLGPVKAVAAGCFHTCAVRCDGRLVCFGYNTSGQCNVPADIGQVMAVAASYQHTAAVQCDGRLVCFGHNTSGQCDVPAYLEPVVAVITGYSHTCAVQFDGRRVCFGPYTSTYRDIVPVMPVSASYRDNWAVKSDGSLVKTTQTENLRPLRAVAASTYHICVVQCDGHLDCFGRNREGQCIVPADLLQVTDVAAGSDHTCAVQCDGRLVCFGDNSHGQCNVPADLGPVQCSSGAGMQAFQFDPTPYEKEENHSCSDGSPDEETSLYEQSPVSTLSEDYPRVYFWED